MIMAAGPLATFSLCSLGYTCLICSRRFTRNSPWCSPPRSPFPLTLEAEPPTPPEACSGSGSPGLPYCAALTDYWPRAAFTTRRPTHRQFSPGGASAANQKGRGEAQGLPTPSRQHCLQLSPGQSFLPLAPPAREVSWLPAGLTEEHPLLVPFTCPPSGRNPSI